MKLNERMRRLPLLGSALVFAVLTVGGAAGQAIAAPTIEILSPAGREMWPGGVPQTITWTSANLDPAAVISIWFWDASAGWTFVANLPRTETSYTWPVPTRPVAAGWLYVGSWVSNTYEVYTTPDGPVRILNRSRPDLDGNGQADILWRHTSGAPYLWEMAGATVTASAYLPSVSNSWEIQGLGDLSGEGTTDILWRESASGSTYVWEMRGATVTAVAFTEQQADATWAIQGLADFGGDGRSDILWRHSSGSLYLWEMAGATVTASASLPMVPNEWQVADLGDFDGDLRADILWREKASGATYLWLMDGPIPTGHGFTDAQADTSWTLEGVGDFDGDGRTDILWRHASGVRYVWLMHEAIVASSGYLPTVDSAWTIRQLADLNGDGRTDILWREGVSGNTYVWLMNGLAKTAGAFTTRQADNSWTVQVP